MDPNAVAVASLVVGVAALLVAVPAARPFALVIALVGIGVAVWFLLPGPPSVSNGGSGETATGPDGPTDGSGVSIAVSPRSVRMGDAVTVTGSGFPPGTGVAFRYSTVARQDYPIDGFAVADDDGRFRGQARLTAPVCDETGAILVFLGTNDRRPDPSGPVKQPVAESAVTVTCR